MYPGPTNYNGVNSYRPQAYTDDNSTWTRDTAVLPGHRLAGALTPGQGAHEVPPHVGNRSVSHNPSPSLSFRPPKNRSWTLSTTPVQTPDSTPAHLSLPLTSSPLPYRPTLHIPRTSSSFELHSISPSSSVTSRIEDSRSNHTFGQPPRPRKGGPPKAKLGGPGGKTFDEMVAAGIATPPRSASKNLSPTPSSAIPILEPLDEPKEERAKLDIQESIGKADVPAELSLGPVGSSLPMNDFTQPNGGSNLSELQQLITRQGLEMESRPERRRNKPKRNKRSDSRKERNRNNDKADDPPSVVDDNPWEAPPADTLRGFGDALGNATAAKTNRDDPTSDTAHRVSATSIKTENYHSTPRMRRGSEIPEEPQPTKLSLGNNAYLKRSLGGLLLRNVGEKRTRTLTGRRSDASDIAEGLTEITSQKSLRPSPKRQQSQYAQIESTSPEFTDIPLSADHPQDDIAPTEEPEHVSEGSPEAPKSIEESKDEDSTTEYHSEDSGQRTIRRLFALSETPSRRESSCTNSPIKKMDESDEDESLPLIGTGEDAPPTPPLLSPRVDHQASDSASMSAGTASISSVEDSVLGWTTSQQRPRMSATTFRPSEFMPMASEGGEVSVRNTQSAAGEKKTSLRPTAPAYIFGQRSLRRPLKGLRPSAPTSRPGETGHSSTPSSSSHTGPSDQVAGHLSKRAINLRAGAAPFVPPERNILSPAARAKLGLPPLLGIPSGAANDETETSPDRPEYQSSLSRRHGRHDSSMDQGNPQSKKRLKLRPSATEFVPRPPGSLAQSITHSRFRDCGVPKLDLNGDLTPPAPSQPPLMDSRLDPATGLDAAKEDTSHPASAATQEAAQNPLKENTSAGSQAPRSSPAGDSSKTHEQDNTEDRPHRLERQPAKRTSENSYHPSDLPPLGSPRLLGHEVTIHTSHPFKVGLSTSRRSISYQHSPDIAPRETISDEDHDRCRALGPAILSQPAAQRSVSQPSLSTLPMSGPLGAPFTSRTQVLQAQMTAAAAKRINRVTASVKVKEAPSLTVVEDSSPSQRSPIIHPSPDPSKLIPTGLLDASPISQLAHSSKSHTPLVDAPSPGPEVKIDFVANDQRFREWVFPVGEMEAHSQRPSISRRHTMPVERSIVDGVFRPGIASTRGERMGDFQSLLTHQMSTMSTKFDHEDASILRRTSVEFPMRPKKPTLKVVNETPVRTLSPEQNTERPDPMEDLQKKTPIFCMLETIANTLNDMRNERTGWERESLLEEIQKGLKRMEENLDVVREADQSRLAEILEISRPQNLERITELLGKQTLILNQLHVKNSIGDSVEEEEQLRIREMFQAVLSGQHALLNKMADSGESYRPIIEAVKRVEAEHSVLVSRFIASQEAKERIASLEDQVRVANDEKASLQAEHGEMKKKLATSEVEKRSIKLELDRTKGRINEIQDRSLELQAQVDSLIASKMAMEAERDGLSAALRESLTENERVHSESEELRQELLVEQQKGKVTAESQQSLTTISSAATAFQEEILARMARLDDGMHETMESRVREYESVLNINKSLHSQVEQLRERLEATEAGLNLSRSSAQLEGVKHISEKEGLQLRLETECSAHSNAKERVAELEKQLEQAKNEREAARMMANERASWAKLSEVRIQALNQESIYWRQFALESDRRKYKTFLASKPFRKGTEPHNGSSPPETQLKTPAEGLSAHEDGQVTPTRKGGEYGVLVSSTSEIALLTGLKGMEDGQGGMLWDVARED